MLHPRAFKVTVAWILLLLLLGSIVHATESSLACPDWPTCYGSLVPEMTGGIFWEHLHRLVATGLGLMIMLATWLAWKETGDRPWILRWSLAALGLVIVQGVFGGLTVIYQLPDLVSTTHWTLALALLVLCTVLATATARRSPPMLDRRTAVELRLYAAGAAGLVFVQSMLGAFVRHSDAGMACPDAPLCLGQVVPPLVNTPIVAHFSHRVIAVIATLAIVSLALWARRVNVPTRLGLALDGAVGLVLVQVGLGVASVLSVLAVTPVSLHSLGAALLTVVLVHVATRAHLAAAVDDEPIGASESDLAHAR